MYSRENVIYCFMAHECGILELVSVELVSVEPVSVEPVLLEPALTGGYK